MSLTVRDVMNDELLYLSEGTRLELALPQILRFGVTAVPVVDATNRPVGVVSLRDLVGERPIKMSSPAHTIEADAPVDVAAKKLAEQSFHHLVVVDGDGKAVGMVSSLDLLRALVGVSPKHPSALHGFDRP